MPLDPTGKTFFVESPRNQVLAEIAGKFRGTVPGLNKAQVNWDQPFNFFVANHLDINWVAPPEVSDSRVGAQMIITDDESPGLRSQLAMMMVGGAIMHSAMLLGGTGYLMAYKKITRTPKMVHITAAFEREFPGAAHIISCLAKNVFQFRMSSEPKQIV